MSTCSSRSTGPSSRSTSCSRSSSCSTGSSTRARVSLNLRDALVWLIYPLIWTGLTIGRGAADGWYPYPFLDPANGGWAAVVIAVAGITIGFVLLAFGTVAIGNARRRAMPEAAA